MAQNHAGSQHPWTSMDDQELLKSVGLYGQDIVTGEEGYIIMDNLEPNPQNPIIEAFFRNIGYADQLGPGINRYF